MRKLAGKIADSAFLRRGKSIWEKNRSDWIMPLSRTEKLLCGVYLILHDYASGTFPPRFDDRTQTHDAEIAARTRLPNFNERQFSEYEMRKPFWWESQKQRGYLEKYLQLSDLLVRCGVGPPARMLELGCGSGWIAEIFGAAGFNVVGTTIGPADVEDARQRAAALAAKGFSNLDFRESAMEGVDEVVRDLPPFDAVYVFEALHHAFSSQEAIAAAYRCLRPGGWLLLCDEPNWLHLFISYRVARITNTHEIGFTRRQLKRQLESAGFRQIVVSRNQMDFLVRPHWLAAQR